MPGKTPTQKVEELTERHNELERAFEKHRLLTEIKLEQLEARDALRARTEEELRKQVVELVTKNAAFEAREAERAKVTEETRTKVADLVAKNATLEERARGQEKTTDRGFNFLQAAIICVISIVGGALLSQLGVKK